MHKVEFADVEAALLREIAVIKGKLQEVENTENGNREEGKKRARPRRLPRQHSDEHLEIQNELHHKEENYTNCNQRRGN